MYKKGSWDYPLRALSSVILAGIMFKLGAYGFLTLSLLMTLGQPLVCVPVGSATVQLQTFPTHSAVEDPSLRLMQSPATNQASMPAGTADTPQTALRQSAKAASRIGSPLNKLTQSHEPGVEIDSAQTALTQRCEPAARADSAQTAATHTHEPAAHVDSPQPVLTQSVEPARTESAKSAVTHSGKPAATSKTAQPAAELDRAGKGSGSFVRRPVVGSQSASSGRAEPSWLRSAKPIMGWGDRGARRTPARTQPLAHQLKSSRLGKPTP